MTKRYPRFVPLVRYDWGTTTCSDSLRTFPVSKLDQVKESLRRLYRGKTILIVGLEHREALEEVDVASRTVESFIA